MVGMGIEDMAMGLVGVKMGFIVRSGEYGVEV